MGITHVVPTVLLANVRGEENLLLHGALQVEPRDLEIATGIFLSQGSLGEEVFPREAEERRQQRLLQVMTQSLRDAIVTKHNELRAAIYYPCTAGDMETLVYDQELEEHAQAYAEKCESHPDPLNPENGWGENIAITTAHVRSAQLQKTLTYFTDAWFREEADVDWGKYGIPRPKNYSSSDSCKAPLGVDRCMIGHYTQVAWASSKRVGCGYKNCAHSRHTGKAAFILVCKYTPAGNSEGVAPFLFGARGEACATLNPEYRSLCAINSVVVRCMDVVTPLSMVEGNPEGCANLGQLKNTWCESHEDQWAPPGQCPATCGKCKQPLELGRNYCNMDSKIRPTQDMIAAYEEYITLPTQTNATESLIERPPISISREAIVACVALVGLSVCCLKYSCKWIRRAPDLARSVGNSVLRRISEFRSAAMSVFTSVDATTTKLWEPNGSL